MSPTGFDETRFRALPLIAILRGLRHPQVEPVVKALQAGGLNALEITMNTPGADEQIAIAMETAGGALEVGAGTVTTLDELDRAQSAGASFIVTPVLDREIIAECVRRRLPVFPGAFTPTEVFDAYRFGATMVKLFPAGRLGSDYVRDVKGPLTHVPLLATGGITPEMIPTFVQAGASGFGLGSQLLTMDRINDQDWAWLERRTRQYCSVWYDLDRHPVPYR
jgi:2-dehydro-3-deoxyphosphogluconate aldolase / (4S)-4-hydroxy-2-oxoglutarate aldolase